MCFRFVMKHTHAFGRGGVWVATKLKSSTIVKIKIYVKYLLSIAPLPNFKVIYPLLFTFWQKKISMNYFGDTLMDVTSNPTVKLMAPVTWNSESFGRFGFWLQVQRNIPSPALTRTLSKIDIPEALAITACPFPPSETQWPLDTHCAF